MKIVIVEDEIRIREGLNRLLGKINREYEVVGEADNGKDGVELVRKTAPDLIITDIRMPEMDGIEMLTRLREEDIPTKAIVLSAYSEFAYAQKAIKLGVSEYLLKPIAVDELTQSMSRVAVQIQEQRQVNRSQALRSLENVCYGILLSGMQVNEELSEFLSYEYQVDVQGAFTAVPVYLDGWYQENQEKVKISIQEALNTRDDTRYCLLELPQDKELLILLFDTRESARLERWFQKALLPKMKRMSLQNICFGWIAFEGLARVRESLQAIHQYMDWNIVLGDDVLVSYPKITKVQYRPLSYPIEIEKDARTALCALDHQRLEKKIQAFFNYFYSGDLYSPKEVKEAFVRFLWAMINVAKEINYTQYEGLQQQEILERVMSAITRQELEAPLKELAELIPKEEEKKDSSSYIIQRAQGMIHEFYGQGITLEEIAAKIKITPEYLSTQFRKETGVYFSQYIKDFRIKKAKELLIGTELKLYEVAEKVGFNDPKYFSKVFKETTGQSVAEYRKSNR